ncbi:L-rhamnose isomerase [Victivallis sp. Marseille-Q1083]|uniref:L-rhamnose isomerase n=1 Tax=Victivallis sp. Marseille-Q1083 TaxID=2717288 RepID=UPI00158F3AE9|nr:L-rhamnose isomerase [Victivallis sp. Marseille-Q1083]
MIEQAFQLSKARYQELGVDVEAALKKLSAIAISLHCWQGDDVGGFEYADRALSGGIQATGNYPGKARNAAELRADLDLALRLIPGTHRLNLHAIYAESGRKVERDELSVEQFRNWIDWAAERHLGLDFNPTFFSHPLADDNWTLSHPKPEIREFWIRHGQACRRIAAAMGRELKTAAVNNVWIPDGSKDIPADRLAPRRRLLESLDRIFQEEFPKCELIDAVESKLFGIGSESYVVGSHEFYMGYALSRRKALCLDAGHFHPTEVISDKISSVLCFADELLLHVSRGVRWDSDHVVLFNDELQAIAQEVVRYGFEKNVHIGLDYFDASINRIAAWVIGTRNMLKALLFALLEPGATLRRMELEGDLAGRLAMMEELKGLPFGAVWDYYCAQHDVPVGFAFMKEVREYEKNVLAKR